MYFVKLGTKEVLSADYKCEMNHKCRKINCNTTYLHKILIKHCMSLQKIKI